MLNIIKEIYYSGFYSNSVNKSLQVSLNNSSNLNGFVVYDKAKFI